MLHAQLRKFRAASSFVPPPEDNRTVVATKAKRVGQRHLNRRVQRLGAHQDIQVNAVFRVIEVEIGVDALLHDGHNCCHTFDARRAAE